MCMGIDMICNVEGLKDQKSMTKFDLVLKNAVRMHFVRREE